MKVLIIPAWYSEKKQVASFIVDQALAVQNLGIEVTLLLVVIKHRKDFLKDFFKKIVISDSDTNLRYLNVSYYSIFPYHFLKLYKLQLFFVKLKVLRAVKSYQTKTGLFNLIHFQSLCNNITPQIGFYLANKLSLKYMITEHYTSYEEGGDRIFSPYSNKDMVTNIVQKSVSCISVSLFAANLHQAYFGKSFDVIPNLVPNIFQNKKNAEVDKTGRFNFLSIGGITERKGFLVLIDAFIKAFEKDDSIHLFIVGTGVLKKKLIEKVENFKLSKRIIFIDQLNRTEVISLMDQSQVVVSASYVETFGLTLVEAFFRGLPVIACNSGGPTDFVNQHNGLLCTPGDVDGLSNALINIYEHYDSYDKELIKKNAIDKYSENTIGEKIIECYNKTLL